MDDIFFLSLLTEVWKDFLIKSKTEKPSSQAISISSPRKKASNTTHLQFPPPLPFHPFSKGPPQRTRRDPKGLDHTMTGYEKQSIKTQTIKSRKGNPSPPGQRLSQRKRANRCPKTPATHTCASMLSPCTPLPVHPHPPVRPRTPIRDQKNESRQFLLHGRFPSYLPVAQFAFPSGLS